MDIGPVDWRQASTPELIEQILSRHHAGTRDMLERIAPLLARVVEVHRRTYPFLGELWATFDLLRDDLIAHMMREERVLFPAMARGDTRFVTHPMVVMNEDHARTSRLLDSIHALTDDLTPPQGACPTMIALYAELAELEGDLEEHMRLETEVLFQRYVKTTS